MSPRSASVRRRFWIDPRFVVGVLLVVASVAAVWLLVTRVTSGSTVYVATRTLVAGDTVSGDALAAADVRIGEKADRYLDHRPAGGSVVSRTVMAGELVPRSAITAKAAGQTGRVVLTVTGPLPSVVKEGAVADVWAAAATQGEEHSSPRVIAHGVSVASITRHDDMVSSDLVSVEVQVASDSIAGLLQATADGDTVSLVASTASAGS